MQPKKLSLWYTDFMKFRSKFGNISRRELLMRVIIGICVGVFSLVMSILSFDLRSERMSLFNQLYSTKKELEKTTKLLAALKKEDQYVKNKVLEEEIKNINTTYLDAVTVYEQLIDLSGNQVKTATLEAIFSDSLSYLSKRNYVS